MNIKILSLLYSLSIFQSSCLHKNKSEAGRQPSDTTSTVTPSTIQLSIDAPAFPGNVQMLLPTQYRKESTGYPKNVRDKDWYELYKDHKTGQWLIAKADLRITYSRDECVGEDVMIINSGREGAVLFFTPFDDLTENITTVLEDIPLIPDSNVTFEMNGKSYTLIPKGNMYNDDGTKIKDREGAKDSEGNIYIGQIKSFSLSFSSSQTEAYHITTIEEASGVIPGVIWAGDLNGDDLPDMILDMSDFYESRHLYFFLSDKNDVEKPLKKVTDLNVVNDC